MANTRRLIGHKEVAAMLGIEASTFYEWVWRSRDRPPSFKINGRWRYDPDEVEAWKKSHRVT